MQQRLRQADVAMIWPLPLLAIIWQSKSKREIADSLGIGEITAQTHFCSIIREMQVASRMRRLPPSLEGALPGPDEKYAAVDDAVCAVESMSGAPLPFGQGGINPPCSGAAAIADT